MNVFAPAIIRIAILFCLTPRFVLADDATTPTGAVIPAEPVYPPVPAEIQTPDGHDYHDCKLLRVEADGVVISHRLGVAKLMFFIMPDDFKKSYGYNHDAAKRATAEQEARNAASDAMVVRQSALDQNRSATTAPPTATVVSVAAYSPAPSLGSPPPAPKPAVDRAQIQAEIAGLQTDVAFMQREEAKLYSDGNNQRLRDDGNVVTHGAYADKIAREQAEINQLQQQLR